MRAIIWAVAAAAVMTAWTPADALTIDFDDGVAGTQVGSFYGPLGVTFTRARFADNLGLAGSSGTLSVQSTSGSLIPPASAIVATFDEPQRMVSITGLDVGINGIRLDAFDSTSGGALVATDQFIGSGVGIGVFSTISVSAPTIVRVEFYQPQSVTVDGVLFDDLNFQQAPEPSSLIVMGMGLMALAKVLRRKGKTSPRVTNRRLAC